MKISKKLILVFGLLSAVISVPSALYLTGNIGNAKSAAYKRAKKIMNPDLYLTYRITERIVEANDIKRPIINDTYYDPDVDKLYKYVKIGDFPPEWVVTNIDEDDDYYYASMRY